MSDEKKIRVDDIDYDFNSLPPEVQDMVTMFEMWSADATKHRVELQKAEIAINVMRDKVVEAIRRYNAELVKKLQNSGKSDPEDTPEVEN